MNFTFPILYIIALLIIFKREKYTLPFIRETQISKTNNLKVTVGVLKFVSRTIPLKAEGMIPRPLGRN
jgi:hypothetical protein